MNIQTYAQDLQDRANRAMQFQRIRAQHPEFSAKQIFQYVKDDYAGCGIVEYYCRHEWHYSDTDRCYCCYCGADGDA